jgi:hypothetical protein
MGLLSTGDLSGIRNLRANDGADILRYHCHEPFPTEILGCESGKARAGGDLDLGPWTPQHRSRPVAPRSGADERRVVGLSSLADELSAIGATWRRLTGHGK